MAYSDNKTFDLGELEAPELWITYKRPGLLPYKVSREFITSHKFYNTKRMNIDGYQTMKDIIEDTEAMFEWIISLITAWNITDADTGEVLPLPADKSDVWGDVPGLYLAYIVNTIKEDPTGSDFLAKGVQISTPSMQL
jgi:hypothetical protein